LKILEIVMKKIFWFVGIPAMVFGAPLVSPTVRDYARVAWASVTSFKEQIIPIEVEIERLDQVVGRIDTEVSANTRLLAKDSVSIDRFAEKISSDEIRLVKSKRKLSGMRDHFVSTACEADRAKLESTLLVSASRYKTEVETLESNRQALVARQANLAKLEASLESQKTQRDALKAKVEGLRAEALAMKMRGELSQTAIANSALREALDLAISIGDRLEVERRVFQSEIGIPEEAFELTQHELTFDDVEDLLGIRPAIASN
jgi:multidrug efflux pump subunit AcrA (membrane-fusion protein)